MAILEFKSTFGFSETVYKLCNECWATFSNDKWHDDNHDDWMGSGMPAKEKIRVESMIESGRWTIIGSDHDSAFRVTGLF